MTDLPERIGVYRFENGHMIAIPLPMTFLNHPWESGEAAYIRADLAVPIPPEGQERDALVEKMAKAMATEGRSFPDYEVFYMDYVDEARAALAVLIGDD